MSLTDDDKRWIEQLIDARLAAVRDRKPVNPQDIHQSNTLEQAGGLISRGREGELLEKEVRGDN